MTNLEFVEFTFKRAKAEYKKAYFAFVKAKNDPTISDLDYVEAITTLDEAEAELKLREEAYDSRFVD